MKSRKPNQPPPTSVTFGGAAPAAPPSPPQIASDRRRPMTSHDQALIQLLREAPDLDNNSLEAKRLAVRYLDESGDPYTLGFSKNLMRHGPKVGDVLVAVPIEDADIAQYRSRLVGEAATWEPWHVRLLHKVWFDENPTDWGIAHWYELAYLKVRVQSINPDASLGGIISNTNVFRRLSPIVYGEWNQLPVTEGMLAVETDRTSDHLVVRFGGLRNPVASVDSPSINVLMSEVARVPIGFARSQEFDEFRPINPVAPHPPINDWIWDSLILSLGESLERIVPEMMTRFNEYMVNKINTEVLTRFVRPTEPSRITRRLGRYKKLRGLDPSDKKPLTVASLATFGGLFWGTAYGYHREFVPDPGKRMGEVGVLSILWTKSERFGNVDKTYFDWNYENYYRAYVTILNLIRDNQIKGNFLNFDVMTAEWEIANNLTLPVPNKVYTAQGYGGIDLPAANLYSCYWNGEVAMQNKSVGDFVTAVQRRSMRRVMGEYHLEPRGRCTIHDEELEYTRGEEKSNCPIGPHEPETEMRGGSAELSYWLQRREIQDTEGLQNLLLRMAPDRSTTATDEWIGYIALNEDGGNISRPKRGTTIIITNNDWLETVIEGTPYLVELDRWSDIIMVDVGARDFSEIFRLDPELMRNPRWICTQCNETKEYVKLSWRDTGRPWPPVCHGHPMMPVGEPIIKYVYVGDDVENMPYHIMRVVGGTIDGVALD